MSKLKTNRNYLLALILCPLLMITGCTSLSPEQPSITANQSIESTNVDPQNEPSSSIPEAEDDIQYGHFSEDVLTKVIIAELAGQRGLNQQALDAYLALAKETNDVNIIKRATRIATFSRDIPASIEMTKLWLQVQPDAQEAHQTLAFQLVSQGRYREAVKHLSILLEQGSNIDFRIISTRTADDDNAPLIIDPLIADIERLHQRYPENLPLFLSLAHLYQQNEQFHKAHEAVKTLAKKMDNPPEVIILEVQLLEQMGEPERAKKRLAESLKANSQHKQLRLLYGRKLIDEQRYEAAKKQFSIIVKQNPYDYEMLYSLALINMEIENYTDARDSFEILIANEKKENDAHYYIAYIEARNNNPQEALNHYLQVSSGVNFLPTQRNITELMVQADRYTEANTRLKTIRFQNPDANLPLLTMEASVLLDEGMQTEAEPFLNSAIGAFPNNVQLLFLRSVLSQELDNLPLMEQDLRKVIQLNPNSPVAYNSLGYTLADRTDRYEEAYELIKQAIELAPNDPAIIDSLGWVQYQLGLYEEAKISLEKAFELFPDHEVAAHLGEVLWVLGNTRAANKVWQQALETQPDSEHILNAMERLTSSPAT